MKVLAGPGGSTPELTQILVRGLGSLPHGSLLRHAPDIIAGFPRTNKEEGGRERKREGEKD